jgi:hypothetical protein
MYQQRWEAAHRSLLFPDEGGTCIIRMMVLRFCISMEEWGTQLSMLLDSRSDGQPNLLDGCWDDVRAYRCAWDTRQYPQASLTPWSLSTKVSRRTSSQLTTALRALSIFWSKCANLYGSQQGRDSERQPVMLMETSGCRHETVCLSMIGDRNSRTVVDKIS